MTLNEYIAALNPIISDLVGIRDDAVAAKRLKDQGLLGGAQNRADVRANITARVSAAAAKITALALDSDA